MRLRPNNKLHYGLNGFIHVCHKSHIWISRIYFSQIVVQSIVRRVQHTPAQT